MILEVYYGVQRLENVIREGTEVHFSTLAIRYINHAQHL
jgi:hypothetical protein